MVFRSIFPLIKLDLCHSVLLVFVAQRRRSSLAVLHVNSSADSVKCNFLAAAAAVPFSILQINI